MSEPAGPTNAAAAAPELSIVIVSYRCAELLADCLESLGDTLQPNVTFETLVIDNASGDETAATARAHPQADVTELDANVGFARANNMGIARARGAAVLVLNPDTLVPPGGLRRCLDELWSHPDVGVLTPRLESREGLLDRRCKRGFPTPWASFCYFTGLDRRFSDSASTRYTAGWVDEYEVGDVESVSGAFMLMPARALREVGGFDEQFFMYAEDLDLCLRFIALGWRVRYWPRVAVIHVGAGSNVNGQRPAEANAAYFRTMAPFVRKHVPGARGRVLAALVKSVGEAGLAATTMLPRRSKRPGREVR